MKRYGLCGAATMLVGLLALLAVVVACGQAATATPTRAAAPTATPTRPPATQAPTATATRAPVAAPTATATATPAPQGTQAKSGGILRRVHEGDPPKLDLHQVTTNQAAAVLMPVYNNLVFPGEPETTKIVADLAETWSVSLDGLTWTFNLRKNVKWSDGVEFTADDVVASLTRIKSPAKGTASPRAAQLESIQTVEAVDKNTVKVVFSKPSAAFLPILAQGWTVIVAKHVLDANAGDLSKVAIGTGPYLWDKYEPGVSVTLKKNPNYWRAGLPYLDGQQFTFIKDSTAACSAFKTKQVDTSWGANTCRYSQDDLDALKKEFGDLIVIDPYKSMRPTVTYLNLRQAPWNDIRVRKAINLAYDRYEMIDAHPVNSVYEIGLIAVHPAGPWALPYDEVSKLPGYRRPKDADMAEAKRLLQEAGVKLPLQLKALTEKNQETHALLQADQLKKLGIEATLDVQETTVYYDRSAKGDFGLSFGGYTIPLDDPDAHYPIQYLTTAGRNYGGYSNAEVDALIRQQSAEMDPVKRKEIVLQLIRKIMDDMPIIGAYNDHRPGMPHWSWVKNFTAPQLIAPNNAGFRMEFVWLDQRK